MTKTLTIYLSMSILLSVDVASAACDGSSGRNHINPDGSLGGFVASTARVAKSVTIDPSSEVCENAFLVGNVKVKASSKLLGHAKIEGNSEISNSTIKGNAKVFGSAIVRNSAVCQESLINFKLSDSNYYCSIFEPEPKDPGELGRKTLIGIDSNVNGIRDDVEIWINRKTSNTPWKNLNQVREQMYLGAKDLQKAVAFQSDKDKAKSFYISSIRNLQCVTINKDAYVADLAKKIKVEVYNTQERLNAWLKVNSYLSGVQSSDLEIDCN